MNPKRAARREVDAAIAAHLAAANHGGGSPAWNDITGKPSTFAPSAHSHVKADVGLGNVDNTSDAAKPVSTATQTALDGKQAAGSYAAAGHSHAGTYEPANANIQAHVAAAHAPSNAQKNSDITKGELEAKLTGVIASHSHAGGGGGPTVKSGIVSLTAGGTAAVVFVTPFGVGVTPQVTVSAQFNTSDTSTTLCAHTITNLGFTIRGAGNAAGNVAWIATNAGNT